VKAVPPDAYLFEPSRDRKAADGWRKAMVEDGVEAGNLHETGPPRPDGPHRRQAARLVQRRKRCQGGRRFDVLVGDFGWTVEIASAVNDAMPNGDQRAASEIVIAPIRDIGEQGFAVIVGWCASLLEQVTTGGVGHGEAWLGLVFVEQAFAKQVRLSPRNIEQSEFDAGRAGIQDQDGVGHHRYS